MIRLTGESADGRKFVLLGIDKENVRRLTNGQPIRCSAESVGIERDVIVVYGESLQKITDELAEAGFIFPGNQQSQA